MITLIHGDDTTASRNYFFDIKSKTKEIISLDGSKVTVTDLTQALEGQDLFGEAKHIFIEELLSKRKSSKELDVLISLLITHNSSQIILWESKELTKKQLQQFNNITIKQFDIPKTIFALLDALKPHNGKQLIELFHKTLQDKDAEFVFFMLQRQVRILLTMAEPSHVIPDLIGDPEKDSRLRGTDSIISEVARIAPWQKGKLEKQTQFFGLDKLLLLHSQLFDIELGLKTGNLTLPLPQTLDLLLLSL